ncbi:ATP-binding cassette domain-containing protein [Salinarchaeum chitinilyticum]
MQSQPTESDGQSTSRTSGEPPAIAAEDVHVTYADGTEAVSGVDLAIEPGECFGFLGPNGAGKSTTIKTLVSLIRPTQGSVAVHGHGVADDPRAVRAAVGYMPQTTSVDPELTARENVRFAATIHGVPAAEREARVEEFLDVVGLTPVADDRADAFSGGMQKRLDAATALVHRPPVVFLDEPTTGLDPEARMELWDYFEAMNDAGTTVFLTTQYLEEVDRLCDRIALLQDGEIVARDTPAALKAGVGGDVLELSMADASRAALDRAETAVREADAFDDPAPRSDGDETAGVHVERTSDGLSITAADAREGVMDLFVALDDAGVTVTSMDVRSPTLDDVFLSLTGEQPDEHDGARTEGSR